jgi:hypothetical protein
MKKEDSLNQPISHINFWVCTGLLVILLSSTLAREIDRPFYGLHSWGQATGAWVARTHVKYGLGYTKGLSTWAVGDPPPAHPKRYVDHPQLGGLLAWAAGCIFGIHEWTWRLINLITSIGILLLFLRILRGLVDEKTTLLAGLLFVLFPITGYFTAGGWSVLFGFMAMWFYLVLIRSLNDGPEPALQHKIGLAASLFLGLQIAWTGFFLAFGVGLHYVCRCIKRKQFPEKTLLTILILAPLSSLFIDFTIMAASYGWNIQKIIDLFIWRSAKGELTEQMQKFDWGLWFAKLWEFSITDFTLPVLIIAIIYLTFGQLFVFMETKPDKKGGHRTRQFPQFWLFTVPAITQLLVLRGALWKHQTWLHPLDPIVAIAAALGIMLLADILKKVHKTLADISIVALVAISAAFCFTGTNYYYSIRWQAPAKIEMFKMLNKRIPPDKALLSFEDFIVDQHESKGAFYRPEIAWYLDREIVPAGVIKDGKLMAAETVADIEQKAQTGRFPYYLIPRVAPLAPLLNQLAQRYKYEDIPGEPGETTKDGKFLKASMPDYILFDLNSKVKN